MPIKKDKESKKGLILNAALKLFSQKGFHATSTKEIANESGVAEGLIFYYFGDKRKLLLHLVNNFSFSLQLEEEKVILAQLPLEEALVHYGMSYLHFLKKNLEYIMLIWSPEMIQDETVSQEVFHLIKDIGSIGSVTLKSEISSEQFDENSFEVAMMALTSSILVYFMIHSRFGQNVLMLEEEPYIRNLVHLLLHGMTEKK